MCKNKSDWVGSDHLFSKEDAKYETVASQQSEWIKGQDGCAMLTIKSSTLYKHDKPNATDDESKSRLLIVQVFLIALDNTLSFTLIRYQSMKL